MRGLTATFYDADGVVVETVDGPPQDVLAAAVRFMYLHGADPDGDGIGAQPGCIEFEPCDDVAEPDDLDGVTVGDVLSACSGLPDGSRVLPDWSGGPPGDSEPAVRLDFVRASADEDGPYLSVGVSLVHLEDIEGEDEDDE